MNGSRNEPEDRAAAGAANLSIDLPALVARYKVPLLIMAAAFVVRFLHLADIQNHPMFAPRISDLEYYDQTALQILNNQGPFLSEPFFRAPLYPHFLALLYRIFGHNYFAAMFVQILIGSMSCGLIYHLGNRLFNRQVATIAGFIAAFYGVFVYYDADFELPALEIFMTLLFMIISLKVFEKPTVRKLFWSGVLAGLVAIHRPNILAYAVLMPGLLCLYLAGRSHWKAIVRFSAVFLLGLSMFPGLTTLRNYLVSKDPVFIAYQGGLNFYLSYHPTTNGAVPYMPGMGNTFSFRMVHEMAEAEAGRKLTFSEESKYWTQRGMAYIRQDPKRILRLTAKKIAMFWNGYEIHNNRDVYQYKKISKVLDLLVTQSTLWMHLPFGLIGPLGLLGMFVAWRRWRQLAFVYLFIVVYMMTVIAFFVPGRFRVPVVPYLILFASYALVWFYDKFRQGHRYLEVYGAGLLFLVIIMNLPPLGRVIPPPPGMDYPEAGEYMRTGQFDKAIEVLKKASEEKPFDPFYPSGIAEAYLAMGDKRKALESYRKVMERFPFYTPARLNMERLEQEVDPLEYKARKHMDNALRLQHQAKDYAGAEKEFLKAIEANPNSSMSYAMLAVFYEHDSKGRRYTPEAPLAKAADNYRKAIELDGSNAEARYNLALLYDRFGIAAPQEAYNLYEQYLNLRPGGNFETFAKMRMNVLRPLLKEGSSFTFYIEKARQYENEGRFDEADTAFAKALSLNPNTAQSNESISQFVNRKMKRGQPRS